MRMAAATALALLTACTSAGLPEAQSPLNALDRANKTQIDVALRQAAVAETIYYAEQGTYTPDLSALTQTGLRTSGEVTLRVARGDATGFCIEATHGAMDGTWHTSGGGDVVASAAEGSC